MLKDAGITRIKKYDPIQREEYTMAERKTQDVLKADQMVHLYQGNIQKVYVAGEVYHYENERDGKKTYVQEFYGSYVAPDANGTFDDKKRGLFRAVTTEPFKDLSECAGKDMLILVSGQTFKVEDENKKQGKKFLRNKTFCRSIKEAVVDEEGKVRGGADIMPASIAVKSDFYAANNRHVSGWIGGVKLNDEKKTKEGEPFAYRQVIFVRELEAPGKFKEQLVVFHTKAPVDPADFEKGTKLSMPGAMRVVEVLNKETGKHEKKEVFEPALIAKFPDKNKELDEKGPIEADFEVENEEEYPDIDLCL